MSASATVAAVGTKIECDKFHFVIDFTCRRKANTRRRILYVCMSGSTLLTTTYLLFNRWTRPNKGHQCIDSIFDFFHILFCLDVHWMLIEVSDVIIRNWIRFTPYPISILSSLIPFYMTINVRRFWPCPFQFFFSHSHFSLKVCSERTSSISCFQVQTLFGQMNKFAERHETLSNVDKSAVVVFVPFKLIGTGYLYCYGRETRKDQENNFLFIMR